MPAPVPRIMIGKRDGQHMQMIKKYDTNGDGRLDEKEKAAAKEGAKTAPKVTPKKF
jgi:5-hydroxyisourate hydrolase-like protein (transthyretin family)